MDDYKKITNFIYEVGILSKTPRSGLWFLGTGKQSVAEHLLRTAYLGYVLSYLSPQVDRFKIILMCLFHDLGEGRTSDLNYIHQKYGRLAEATAINDIASSVPFGKEIKDLYEESKLKQSLEAKLVKEADNLEWLATLREEEVKGNIKAQKWAAIAYKRLKTPMGKKLGKLFLTVNPDAWWFDEKDEWFVDRDLKLKPWKRGSPN
ncbi:HD domain-containing protein [Candidatus Azambacteria bacterium]|nr:HD domain-containing protein [Candidatus Azambacteria bacterium]